MLPPSTLYLTALLSRLVRICLMRVSSPSTARARRSSLCSMCRPRLSAVGSTMASAALTSGPSSSATGSSFSMPDSMRDRSSVSLIMCSRCQPACWICAAQARWCSASAGLRSRLSSCAKPSIAFSGVRSSWLMRETNSLFARLELSADSRARSASARRRCSPMSSTTPTVNCRPAVGIAQQGHGQQRVAPRCRPWPDSASRGGRHRIRRVASRPAACCPRCGRPGG